MPIKTLLTAVAAMGIAAAPQLAMADEVVSQQREVRFYDLDIQTPEDQAELERRIRRAAKDVCGVGPTKSLNERAAANACYREAMTRGQARMAQKIADTRYGG